MELFAYQPEGLMVVTVLAILMGLLMPAFQRLGFGTVVSLLLGLMLSFIIFALLSVPGWIVDVLDGRRKRSSTPRDPPEDDGTRPEV